MLIVAVVLNRGFHFAVSRKFCLMCGDSHPGSSLEILSSDHMNPRKRQFSSGSLIGIWGSGLEQSKITHRVLVVDSHFAQC
jgi:hypothetical protein